MSNNSRAVPVDDKKQAEVHYQHANELYAQAKFPEAVKSYQQAAALMPQSAMIVCNLGAALWAQGRRTDAIQTWQHALKLDPDSLETYNNLGNALCENGQFADAMDCYQRVLTMQPELHAVHNNIAGLLTYQGRLAEARQHYQTAMAMVPDHAPYRSNYLFSLNYGDDLDDAALRAEHAEYDQRFGSPPQAFTRWDNPPDPDRPLRVGYVSGEFFESSVGFLIEPILEHHQRDQFFTVCYATGRRADATTARMRALAGAWCDVRGLDAMGMAEQVRADGIDILVDLIGHTTANRLPTFALKPAPVQVSYAGYVNTTGLRAMDYYVGDNITLTPANAALFQEILVQLPWGLYCYRPPAFTPEVAPLPCRDHGRIRFASFNTVAKLNPFTLQLWSDVLHAVPGSSLILKDKAFSDHATVRRLQEDFARQGIPAERLELRQYTPLADHLAHYADVDIALDPHPFNGGINSLQALWQGVPLITLLGTRHASRVGASLMGRVGLGELVAHHRDDYVAKAAACAADRPRLEAIRSTLRTRMQGTALINAPMFMTHWESALRLFWRRFCETVQTQTGGVG